MTESSIAQTPEAIAWNLYNEICHAENKQTGKTREYILSTYAECLKATTGSKTSMFDMSPAKKVVG